MIVRRRPPSSAVNTFATWKSAVRVRSPPLDIFPGGRLAGNFIHSAGSGFIPRSSRGASFIPRHPAVRESTKCGDGWTHLEPWHIELGRRQPDKRGAAVASLPKPRFTPGLPRAPPSRPTSLRRSSASGSSSPRWYWSATLLGLVHNPRMSDTTDSGANQTVRPDEFFFDDEIPAPHGDSGRHVDVDLLTRLRTGQLDRREDIEVPPLAILIHDELEKYGTSGGQEMSEQEMRQAILALRAVTERLATTSPEIPFRDFGSFRSWWLLSIRRRNPLHPVVRKLPPAVDISSRSVPDRARAAELSRWFNSRSPASELRIVPSRSLPAPFPARRNSGQRYAQIADLDYSRIVRRNDHREVLLVPKSLKQLDNDLC